MNNTTRAEHLDWCIQRALEYVDTGDLQSAFAMGKHPDTQNHAAIPLGTMLLFGGHLGTAHEMRKFIEGFN